jgi:protein-S-isoprenylcysteine O-methyltransferase Ste14
LRSSKAADAGRERMGMAAVQRWAVATGNLLFRFRNALGPFVVLCALALGTPHHAFGRRDLDLLLDLAGVLVALAGQSLRVLTIGLDYIERGGRNHHVYASRLVQGGVFAHCRNPLYVGNILICIGLVLIVHSMALYLVIVPFVLLAYVCIVAAEEAFLRDKFGPEYDAYCRRVPRWWPRWQGWRESTRDMRFHWQRVLVKEYNTLFLLGLAIPALWAWSEYRIGGADAVPPSPAMGAALAAWLACYLGVRALKKSGRVRG